MSPASTWVDNLGRAALMLALILALLLPLTTLAEKPKLALVIDDIGWDLGTGRRVLELPATLTVAVLPGTPAGRQLAREAHQRGQEVILHQPMSAEQGQEPGPGKLLPDMDRAAIATQLTDNLAEIPHHRGVSNHMGSLLTRCEACMGHLMAELSGRGLYFLDSRTTAQTVAQKFASGAAVASTRRDVFLDNLLDAGAISRALEDAVRLAERRGHAVAIGHPHALTLDILEAELPAILDRVELVPVSALVTLGEPPQASASVGE